MPPSAFPAALDTLSNPAAADSTNAPSHAQQHIDENDSIEAVEGELGTNPSGIAATVAARFTALDSQIATMDREVTIGLTAPAAPTTGLVWVDTNLSPPTIKTWNGTAWVNAVPAVTPPAVGQEIIVAANTTSTSYITAGSGVALAVTKGRVLVLLKYDIGALLLTTNRIPQVALRMDSNAESIAQSFYVDQMYSWVDSINFVGQSFVQGGVNPEGLFLAYLFTGLTTATHTFQARLKSLSGSTGAAAIANVSLIAMEM